MDMRRTLCQLALLLFVFFTVPVFARGHEDTQNSPKMSGDETAVVATKNSTAKPSSNYLISIYLLDTLPGLELQRIINSHWSAGIKAQWVPDLGAMLSDTPSNVMFLYLLTTRYNINHDFGTSGNFLSYSVFFAGSVNSALRVGLPSVMEIEFGHEWVHSTHFSSGLSAGYWINLSTYKPAPNRSRLIPFVSGRVDFYL
jgi:hypothetical protein